MGRGITLGRLAGARWAVDGLFLLLLAVAAVLGFSVQVLIVAASLAAHELAHLLAAWGAGVEVAEVRVTPFGGVAHLSEALEMDPLAEAAIALAGPFNSLALAAGAAFLGHWSFWDRQLLDFCFQSNAALAVFNLIPALPLDGGRILRGLLSRRWGYGPVSRLLAASGRICGAVLTAVSLVALATGRLYLTPLVAGPYLWWFAGREEVQALYRTFRLFLRKQQRAGSQQVLPARHLVALGSITLRELLPQLAARPYHIVLVVDDALRPLGTLSEADLQDAFRRTGPQVLLADLLLPPEPPQAPPRPAAPLLLPPPPSRSMRLSSARPARPP